MRFLLLLDVKVLSVNPNDTVMTLFDLPDRRRLFVVKMRSTPMYYTVCHPWVVLRTEKDCFAIC